MTRPIPEGHQTIVPHLTVSNGVEALEFYVKALGAEELNRSVTPDGKVMHAAMQLGDCKLFLSDSFGGPAPAPAGLTLNLLTENADALYARAVEAGAEPVMPLMDAFWGDRYGQIKDPFGHTWAISTRQKDMTEEEVAEAAKAFFGGHEQG